MPAGDDGSREGGVLDDPVAFGIPGLTLEPGDHICAFYRGPRERDEILVPYLREGLDAGDKCTCVVDSGPPADVIAALRDAGVDVERSVASGHLDVLPASSAYLRGGTFSVSRMITFWDDRVGMAVEKAGFSFARSVGEMTWALRDVPGTDQLAEYESELNDFLPRHPQVILCLYDLEVFGSELILDMLKTHPKLLLGGMVLDNPHYLAPHQFAEARR